MNAWTEDLPFQQYYLPIPEEGKGKTHRHMMDAQRYWVPFRQRMLKAKAVRLTMRVEALANSQLSLLHQQQLHQVVYGEQRGTSCHEH